MKKPILSSNVRCLVTGSGWNLAPHEKDTITQFHIDWVSRTLKQKQFKAYRWKVYKTKHLNQCAITGESGECQYVQIVTMDKATRTNNNRIIP